MFQDVLFVKSAILHRFPHQHILVVGDVMLDRYLRGTANRISPEAPVPVVHLSQSTHSLGGAANVAHNLSALGAAVALVGLVGNDAHGALFRETCREKGIDDAFLVAVEGFCTVTKTRILADDRQLLRLDEEVTGPRPPEDTERLWAAVQASMEARRPDALILSDYAKGVCSPEFCARVIAYCRSIQVPVYVDPKGRNFDKYKGATAVKPNRVEIHELALAMNWEWQGPVVAAKRLLDHLDLEFVAVTLGAQGMAIVHREGVHEMPTVAREVFDVSGAGDTVIATLVTALSSGVGLIDSAALANVAAAEVVAHIGSIAIASEDLLVAVQAQNRVFGSRKLYTLEEIGTLVSAWRKAGLKVALTNGCFDLLHAGHVRLLEDSAAQSDRLIVALNADDSITRLKGAGRPLMPEEQRVAVLSALECVDAVVVFEDDTPLQVIEAVRPDLLIKGGDYTVSTVVGAEVVLASGGKVILVPLVKHVSTSRLVNKISKL